MRGLWVVPSYKHTPYFQYRALIPASLPIRLGALLYGFSGSIRPIEIGCVWNMSGAGPN